MSQLASTPHAERLEEARRREPSAAAPPDRVRAPPPHAASEASSASHDGAQPTSAQQKCEVVKRMSNAELGALLDDAKTPTAEVNWVGCACLGPRDVPIDIASDNSTRSASPGHLRSIYAYASKWTTRLSRQRSIRFSSHFQRIRQ